MNTRFPFLKNLFKKRSQILCSFYVLFILTALVILGGGPHFWKNREIPPTEVTTNVTLGPSPKIHAYPPAPSLPADEIKEPRDDDENDESEDEDNSPGAQSPWTLLKTALPSRYYERIVQTSTPSVALILTGLGLNKAWTDHVLATLKKKTSLVFSPYSPHINEQLQQAANLGHQGLIALPMEPWHFPNPDPGPLTVLTGVKAEENIEKTKAVLEKLPKGVRAMTGVMGEYGSLFTASKADLEPVLKEIKKQGCVFIDPNSSLHSQTRPICMALGMTCHKIDLALPLATHPTEVDEFFKKIIQSAKENGIIMVSVPAVPAFIDHLPEWMDTLEKNGINFVTIAGLGHVIN